MRRRDAGSGPPSDPQSGPRREPMSRLPFLLRRVVSPLVTVWGVFTLAFAYIVFTPFTEGLLQSGQLGISATDSLFDQYLAWLGWVLTIWDAPVVDPILTHLTYTATYLVPASALAIAAGVGIRIYTVGTEDGRSDAVAAAVAIVAVSIPVFLFAVGLREVFLVPFFRTFSTVNIYERSLGALAPRNLLAALWPTAAMGLFLTGVQLRYAGDVLQEFASAEFVRTARAKGASSWRVGRHIFRNAAIPLLTVIFTDMLGMVVLGVVLVEYILGIPGVGELMLEALLAQDLALVLSLALLTVFVGIFTNFVQDVAYLLFDPRVDFAE